MTNHRKNIKASYKCKALTSKSNYTDRCKKYATEGSKYCKLHGKRRKSGRYKTKEEY